MCDAVPTRITGTALPRGALATAHQPHNTPLVPVSGKPCGSCALLPSHLPRPARGGTAATWQYAQHQQGIPAHHGSLSSALT